jgi:Inner membrane protein YgaP-like, transmembrane domain
MKREHIIRIFAGTLVLTGVALGFWVHRAWLLLPTAVGLNLVQSGITRWCLLEDILKKWNIGQEC